MPPARPPADRLARLFAVLTLVAMTALLVLGGLTTTLGAGMADPGWPRSATYVAEDPKVWEAGNTGLLVEHLHRALGFLTGAFASLLALAVWAGERRTGLRWAGLVAVVLLLGAYGQFYQDMSAVRKDREAAQADGRDPGPVRWPGLSGTASAVCAVAVVRVGVSAVRSGAPAVRLLASVGLVAVMIQGLLGGFRVFLNQVVGTQLAAIHGTFAQVVFALMTCVVALTAAPNPAREIDDEDRRRLGTLAVVVPLSVFVQLVWGVMVRHTGTALSQRLHLLTAFVVTGLVVWLAARALGTPTGRRQLGFYAYHLVGIVGVQVLLGVEAWMGKFARGVPADQQVSVGAAAVRTAHVLVGTALLATTTVLALRVWRRTPAAVEEPATSAPETVAAA